MFAKQVATEVFLLIHCAHHDKDFVEHTLWDNLALGVAKLNDL